MDSSQSAAREVAPQPWPVIVRLVLLGIATVLTVTAAHLVFSSAFGKHVSRHTWSTGAKPADV